MKKTYNIAVALIILVVTILFSLHVAGVYDFSAMKMSMTAQSCILSADSVTLDDYHSELGEEAWVIHGMSGDCAESLVGGDIEVDSDDVEDGDKKAEKDFSIGTYNLEQWFERGVGSSSMTIPEIDHETYTCDETTFGWDCSDQHLWCDNFQDYSELDYLNFRVEYYDDFFEERRVHCARFWDAGDEMDLDYSTTSQFEMDVKNCVGGDCTDRATISKDDKQAVLDLYGDEKAVIKYTGSLKNELIGVDLGDFGVVRTDDQVYYLTLQRLIDEVYDTYYGTDDIESKCEDNPENCANYVNSGTDATNNVFSDASGELEDEPEIDDVEVDSRSLRLYSDVIEYPTWRMVMSAEDTWVGVDMPEADPTITKASDFEVVEGRTHTVPVDVRNDGQGGSIETKIDCSSPLYDDSSSQFVSKDETKRFDLSVSASSVSDTTTVTCDVTAQADFNKDTTTVQGTVEPEEQKIYYDLTIRTNGQGTTDPYPGTHTYQQGETVTLTATPDEGWYFSRWYGDETSQNSQITVDMDRDKTVTAEFTEEKPPDPDIPWMYIIGGAVLIVIGMFAYVVVW